MQKRIRKESRKIGSHLFKELPPNILRRKQLQSINGFQ